jgi:hypothetical protein
MLDIAATWATDNHWQKVDLIAAPIDQAVVEVTADAAPFCAVHDIGQSPRRAGQCLRKLAARRSGRQHPRAMAAPMAMAAARLGGRPARPFITDIHILAGSSEGEL